jgi:hypothetical protein
MTQNVPNRTDLTTAQQTYFLTIVGDGTNTVAEITAEDTDGVRAPTGRGYARRHKRDARNKIHGEILAVQRAFQNAADRYGRMLEDSESRSRFENALKELTGGAAKADKQARKDIKRKAARERYRREHGHDHTDWPLT